MILNSMMDLCVLLVFILSLALVVLGFRMILQKHMDNENDVQVLQRQLRGFGYLMIAQVLMVAGLALCTGLVDIFSMNKIRSRL
jgi:hypothetical protein